MAPSKQYVSDAMVICTTNASLGIASPEGPLSLGQLNRGDSVWTFQHDSLLGTSWTLLLHCVLHRGFQQSWSQIGFCRITSFSASWTAGPRGLSLRPDLKASAPGVGLSASLHASVWAGKLLAPLPVLGYSTCVLC